MKVEILNSSQGRVPVSEGIQTESFVFVSGQGGIDIATGTVVGDDLESQTVQTLENMKRVLTAAGLTMDHVVKCTIYLRDRELYKEFNQIYERYFTAPYPSRTTVYCDLNFDLLVEIDAIAVTKL